MENVNNRDWNELSCEIMVSILMLLNVADIAAASMVCKGWNRACRDPSLWHTLDLSRLSSYCFKVANTRAGVCRHLLYSQTKFTQFLKYVLSLSDGNTITLIFNYYIHLTDDQFIAAAERTPNLKRLVLPKMGDFTREGVDMAMKLWTGLESITITSAVPCHRIFRSIRQYCKNITKMKVSSGCIFEDNHAEHVIECTPNLKVLSIRSITVNIRALSRVLASLKHLETVNICHSVILNMQPLHMISIVDINDLPNYFPPSSLEKLLYCKGGWCLKCQNEDDTTRIKKPYGPLEDFWREDEIDYLAH